MKASTAGGYRPEQMELVRTICLYIATKLGDVMDELVVIGGLVPSLLIAQDMLPDGVDAHVGTVDLDVGLKLTLLDDGRYRTLTERLRNAGFAQDRNDNNKPTRQRWRFKNLDQVTVDFLIPPSLPQDRGGRLRHIEPDFAAVIAPGLHLAFQDRERVTLVGKTITGETATRDIWVCGPGAYVVLKSLAFRYRGENKDAYDLYYLIRNYGTGVDDVAARFTPLISDPSTQQALSVLQQDFRTHDSIGPRRVAEFVSGNVDDKILADVVSAIGQLLKQTAEVR